jgi:hypothetical protein
MPFLFLWDVGGKLYSPNVRYLRRWRVLWSLHASQILLFWDALSFLLAVEPMNKYRNVLLRSFVPYRSFVWAPLPCLNLMPLLALNPICKVNPRVSQICLSDLVSWMS